MRLSADGKLCEVRWKLEPCSLRGSFFEGEMIQPKQSDIGRKVIYQGGAGEPEEGIITSFNDAFVFVRYGAKYNSEATSRKDLHWAHHLPSDEESE